MTPSEKAKAWRLRRNLTVAQLSELTGYSWESIYTMERGIKSAKTWRRDKSKRKNALPQRPVDPYVWARYKNCCAGVNAQLNGGAEFEW